MMLPNDVWEYDALPQRARLLLIALYAARPPRGPVPPKYVEVRARRGGRSPADARRAGDLAGPPAREDGAGIWRAARRVASHHLPLPAALLGRSQTIDALPDYGNSEAKEKTRAPAPTSSAGADHFFSGGDAGSLPTSGQLIYWTEKDDSAPPA
jgi:hypothetical protein